MRIARCANDNTHKAPIRSVGDKYLCGRCHWWAHGGPAGSGYKVLVAEDGWKRGEPAYLITVRDGSDDIVWSSESLNDATAHVVVAAVKDILDQVT